MIVTKESACWCGILTGFTRPSPPCMRWSSKAGGFEWINYGDWENSVISFQRNGLDPDEIAIIACNFTPVPRHNYIVGVPKAGFWKEIFNSDAVFYGGSNMGNNGGVVTVDRPYLGKKQSMHITLPPLAAVFFRYEKPAPDKEPG